MALGVDIAIIAKGILPCFITCGVIGGLLAWRFLKLGIFLLGATFGGTLGYLLCVCRTKSTIQCWRGTTDSTTSYQLASYQ